PARPPAPDLFAVGEFVVSEPARGWRERSVSPSANSRSRPTVGPPAEPRLLLSPISVGSSLALISSTKFFARFEITGTGSPSFARSFEPASRTPAEGSWPARMQCTDGRVDPEELRPVRERWRVGSDSRGTTRTAD